jgi:hypothetical protein
MNKFISLPLILIALSLGACNNTVPTALNQPATPRTENAVTPTFNGKVSLSDLMLLTRDSNKATNPLTPDTLAGLKINGQNVGLASLILPGSSAAEKFGNSATRTAELQKVAAGSQAVLFGGNGVWSLLLPSSDKASVLELQLKGRSDSYKIVLEPGFNRGVMVLDNNRVTGAYQTSGGFATKSATDPNAPENRLGEIFTNPDAYYANGGFSPERFNAFYNSEDTRVIISSNNQQRSFDSANPEQDTESPLDPEAREKIKTEVEDAVQLNPLMHFTGRWTLEDRMLLQLIPGQQLLIELREAGPDRFQAVATLVTGSYSGNLPYTAVNVSNPNNLSMDVVNGSRKITLALDKINFNRIGVKLQSVEGLPELSGFAGLSLKLTRVLE